MELSFNQPQTIESLGETEDAEVSKMSPMTNLALNLSGLSTSIAGTPNRRISWSDPIPGGDKIGLNLDDLSPSYTNSPMLQNVVPSIMKIKHRIRRLPRKTLPSDSDDDKENVTPEVSTEPVRIECQKEIYENKDYDSGYSSISLPNKMSVGSCQYMSSFTKRRSTILSYDEEDSMDNIFHLESVEDNQELPETMSSLLTMPLISQSKSPLTQTTPGQKKAKLPIRRCLSMEADFDPEPSTSEGTSSKNGTYLSSSNTLNKPCKDLDINGKSAFKRPEPPNDYLNYQIKRRKSSPCINASLLPNFKFNRSYSETAATIMHAILKSDLQPELIGDGSKSCVLPLTRGRHQDLKSITSETLAQLIRGEYSEVDSFVLVDCRYPYEYEGGHIQGAKNIFTKEDIMERFFPKDTDTIKRNIIIFHCEFSSERAPNLIRFLRNKDREMNEGNYPRLHHPEVYILDGGYKAFFASYKELCEPQTYKPMNHKDHGFELRHFRAKSKSWGADSKGRSQLRSNSKPTVI